MGPLKYEVGQQGLFLGRAYYGCVATVLPSVSAGLSRKVKHICTLPNFAFIFAMLACVCAVRGIGAPGGEGGWSEEGVGLS